MDRRLALKSMLSAGVAGWTGCSQTAHNGKNKHHNKNVAVGMLYDATRCIGCQACVVKCREANGLPPFTSNPWGRHYDAPMDLSATTKNIIKLYQSGNEFSFVKRQCMHCIDPACVSACMLGAMQKRSSGIVSYDPQRCVGCRYCQVACPFNIPRFEWHADDPKIVKCELCRHRLAAKLEPACTEVCPRQAVIFGSLAQLRSTAKARLIRSPNAYFPKVYGEKDGGGTQVLYLAAVSFDRLGLPALGEQSLPQLARRIHRGIYRDLLVPGALYIGLGLMVLRNRRRLMNGKEDQ